MMARTVFHGGTVFDGTGIAPQPGDLSWARGAVPTPNGVVGVDWRTSLADADMNRLRLLPLRNSAQNLLGNLRQQGVGKNVVHVSGSTLHLCAASRDLIDQSIFICESELVRVLQTPLDLG